MRRGGQRIKGGGRNVRRGGFKLATLNEAPVRPAIRPVDPPPPPTPPRKGEESRSRMRPYGMKPSNTIWSACFSARARSSGLRTVQVITGRLPRTLHRNGAAQGRSCTFQETNCGCDSLKCSRFARRCFSSGAQDAVGLRRVVQLADDAARHVRRELAQRLDDLGIEGLDDDGAVIVRDDLADPLRQPQVAVELALDLDDERHAPGDLARGSPAATGSCRPWSSREIAMLGEVRELAVDDEAAPHRSAGRGRSRGRRSPRRRR